MENRKIYYLQKREKNLNMVNKYYLLNKIKVKERNDNRKYEICAYNRPYYQNHIIDKPIIFKTKEKVKRSIDDNERLLIFY